MSKNPIKNISISNFTFTKVRLSVNPEQEIIRQAFDGKAISAQKQGTPTVAKKPAKPSVSKTPIQGKLESTHHVNKDNDSKSIPIKGSSSRRVIQPPKRYATGETQFYPEKKAKGSNKAGGDKES